MTLNPAFFNKNSSGINEIKQLEKIKKTASFQEKEDANIFVEDTYNINKLNFDYLNVGNKFSSLNTNDFEASQKDRYDNRSYSLFNNSELIRPKSRVNILRLFKPGEILNSVLNK